MYVLSFLLTCLGCTILARRVQFTQGSADYKTFEESQWAHSKKQIGMLNVLARTHPTAAWVVAGRHSHFLASDRSHICTTICVPCVDRQVIPVACSETSPSMTEATKGCKYGMKAYWDGMYTGRGEAVDDGLPSDNYSWYCTWKELAPFWEELVPERSARILIPGVGNDGTIPALYDEGWTNLTAFDYSDSAVERASELFSGRGIRLLCADARDLPLKSNAYDAVFDKGALDAIAFTGVENLAAAINELTWTTTLGGVVVSISRCLELKDLSPHFRSTHWEVLRDGELYMAETGEVSTGLSANLFAWRRRYKES